MVEDTGIALGGVVSGVDVEFTVFTDIPWPRSMDICVVGGSLVVSNVAVMVDIIPEIMNWSMMGMLILPAKMVSDRMVLSIPVVFPTNTESESDSLVLVFIGIFSETVKENREDPKVSVENFVASV